MNRPTHWIALCCAILCALLSASCLDLREEFWLHDDHSAKAEITCRMPRAATLATGGPPAIRAMVEGLLSKEASVDTYSVQVSEQDKHVTLIVRCRLDDVTDLQKLRDSIKRHKDLPQPVRKMVGEFDIGLNGLKGISVSRTVAPAEAVPALRWLPKSQTDGHRIVKIVHFPRAVTDHNADGSMDGGRSLMWESSLAGAIQTPLVYHFVMPIALPWGWIIGGVIGVIILAAAVILVVTKRQGKRASSHGSAS